MKKFFAAVCCVMLVGTSLVAQEEAVTPVADAPAAVQTVVEAPVATTTAAPMVSAPMTVAPMMSAPMTSAPMVQSGCCGSAINTVPMMNVVAPAPVMTPAPVSTGCSTCGTAVAAPVATSACCPTTRTRRYVVRSAVTGLRSRVGGRRSSCCN